MSELVDFMNNAIGFGQGMSPDAQATAAALSAAVQQSIRNDSRSATTAEQHHPDELSPLPFPTKTARSRSKATMGIDGLTLNKNPEEPPDMEWQTSREKKMAPRKAKAAGRPLILDRRKMAGTRPVVEEEPADVSVSKTHHTRSKMGGSLGSLASLPLPKRSNKKSRSPNEPFQRPSSSSEKTTTQHLPSIDRGPKKGKGRRTAVQQTPPRTDVHGQIDSENSHRNTNDGYDSARHDDHASQDSYDSAENGGQPAHHIDEFTEDNQQHARDGSSSVKDNDQRTHQSDDPTEGDQQHTQDGHPSAKNNDHPNQDTDHSTEGDQQHARDGDDPSDELYRPSQDGGHSTGDEISGVHDGDDSTKDNHQRTQDGDHPAVDEHQRARDGDNSAKNNRQATGRGRGKGLQQELDDEERQRAEKARIIREQRVLINQQIGEKLRRLRERHPARIEPHTNETGRRHAVPARARREVEAVVVDDDDDDGDGDDDDGDDGENFERVQVFGPSSTRSGREALRRWEPQEVVALVEGLERHVGPERYIRILTDYGGPGQALRLRNLDELFQKAKEVQSDYLADLEQHPRGRRAPDWLLSV